MSYDVAVVGLGAMGSAIAAHCARRGASVIGLEQFGAAHELGSSGGKSRIIRKAYFESPDYVPLLLRAYELWRELERERGEELLRITGLLMVGREESEIITGALRAAQEHQLPIERLSPVEIRRRYPTLAVMENELGVFEPDGGVLAPELSVRAHLSVAEKFGAHLRFNVTVETWQRDGAGYNIRLRDGSRVAAQVVVLALGAWFKQTLEALNVPVRVQRNVQAWFRPATDAYEVSRFPAFFVDRTGLPAPLYGFPDFGDGVKAAFHAHGDSTDAEHLNRDVNVRRDTEPLARALEAWMPGAAATLREAKPCLYTLTPDGHFVIDRHPEHRNLILCGGFSGHGFKFAPVIGEIVADLALTGESRHPVDFLGLKRFLSG